ncbi:hypothetical protein A2U01_0044180, partial [Trifolium medium]|nr:hypothetical protein [Trifolium medium]
MYSINTPGALVRPKGNNRIFIVTISCSKCSLRYILRLHSNLMITVRPKILPFWSWRNARSSAAQRAGLVLLPVFLLVLARREWVDGATRRFELLRAVWFLVPARRAG